MRVEAKRPDTRGSGGKGPMWLVGGLLVGLVLGYLLSSLLGGGGTANADPSDLAPTGQALWVNMSADSLALTNDEGRAKAYMSVFTEKQKALLLGQEIVRAQQEQDGERLARLSRLGQVLEISPMVPDTIPPPGEPIPGTTPAAGANNALAQLLMFCGGALILILLLVGGGIILTRARQANNAPPAVRHRAARAGTRSRQRATVGELEEEEEEEAPRALPTPERREEEEALDRLFADEPAEADDSAAVVADAPARPSISAPVAEPPSRAATYLPPLDEFVTRYSYGDDGFDMSFSIETAQTEFLGECGVGISEVLGSGKPEQATAFEIWLFDKDDIRTITKVLLSEYAWNNEALRTKLASKGELIPVRQGDTIDLETKSLRVRARLREVEYGSGGPSRNAYFERLVIDLTPQQKQ